MGRSARPHRRRSRCGRTELHTIRPRLGRCLRLGAPEARQRLALERDARLTADGVRIGVLPERLGCEGCDELAAAENGAWNVADGKSGSAASE